MAFDARAIERRLIDRIAAFGSHLRRAGIPVGTGAELDFAAAAAVVDPLDRRQWREAATVTLAKSPTEAAAVAAEFDAFFREGGAAGARPRPGSEVRALRPKAPRPPAGTAARRRFERDEPVLVAVPLGTYSMSAPRRPHALSALADRELRALRRGARRFRRESARLPGRRRTRSRHGRVELGDTIRLSIHHSGELLELRRARPRPTRAEFVLLWDVSGSMREHESRFFGLVHALERTSRRGRVFAFSTRVEEITADVRRFGYRRALETVSRRIDGADGGTRIGRSLGEFVRRFGGTLREQTTLVILSDGWDLGETDEVARELARLRPRVGSIVWVAPYTRRAGFEPRVGALEAALPQIDRLLGPEDFESRWPLRAFPI